MTRSGAEGRSQAGEDFFKRKEKKKKDQDPKQAGLGPILVGEHGRYLIKSGRLAGEFVARAFPKPPGKARGLIAEATGATEEAAIAALHDLIDAREVRRTDERRKDTKSGASVPSIDEYVEAIRQVTLSRPQSAMLMALSLADEQGLTSVRLANAGGYKSQASASSSLASIGLLIADYLSVETSSHETFGDPEGTSLLGFRGKARKEGQPGNWILHAELRDAVRIAL